MNKSNLNIEQKKKYNFITLFFAVGRQFHLEISKFLFSNKNKMINKQKQEVEKTFFF